MVGRARVGLSPAIAVTVAIAAISVAAAAVIDSVCCSTVAVGATTVATGAVVGVATAVAVVAVGVGFSVGTGSFDDESTRGKQDAIPWRGIVAHHATATSAPKWRFVVGLCLNQEIYRFVGGWMSQWY